jgi:hypothetical protein
MKRFLESQPEFPVDLPNGEIRYQRLNEYVTRVLYAGYIEVPNRNVPLRKGHHEGLITCETYSRFRSGCTVIAAHRSAPTSTPTFRYADL